MLGVSLKHYQQFQKLIENYQISDRARQALGGLKLVLMLAPTSTGRNTTIQYLLKTGRYYYIISDTTRQPRINDGLLEENGREYWFKTEEELLEGLEKGEYLEAEIIHGQQVSAISIRELEKAQKEQKTAIKDVDIKGVHNIVRAKPDTIVIMLLPPTFQEWQQRIARRGNMNSEELRRRMETAARIFEDGLRNDFYEYVISDDVSRAASTIDAIAQGQVNPQQGRARELIHRLQFDLNEKMGRLQHL